MAAAFAALLVAARSSAWRWRRGTQAERDRASSAKSEARAERREVATIGRRVGEVLKFFQNQVLRRRRPEGKEGGRAGR